MENRKLIKFLILIFILGFFIINISNVFAYDIETHAYLTKEVFDFYNKNFSNQKIPNELRDYLIDGARREDDPIRWMNHFFDPVYNRGLTVDSKIFSVRDIASVSIVNTATLGSNWLSSKEWAQNSGNQNKFKYTPAIATILSSWQSNKIQKYFSTSNFTWDAAINYWINDNKEMAMFTLGHILHLIEDASVPDHTRNDPHPEDSPYELYTQQFTLNNGDKNLEKRLNDKKPVIFDNLNSYFDELAKYSNNNFYSKDTIGIQSGYNLPEPDYTLKEGDYFYGYKIDNENGDYKIFIKEKQSLFGELIINKNDISLLINKAGGDKVINDYWSRLSTKSIQYGAGIINFFFQEAEKAKNDPNFVKKDDKSFFAQAVSSINNVVSGVVSLFSNSENSQSNSYSQLENNPQTSFEKIDQNQTPPEATPEIQNNNPSMSDIDNDKQNNEQIQLQPFPTEEIHDTAYFLKVLQVGSENIKKIVFKENQNENGGDIILQGNQKLENSNSQKSAAIIDDSKISNFNFDSNSELKKENSKVVVHISSGGGGSSSSGSSGGGGGGGGGSSGDGSNNENSSTPKIYLKILITEIQLSSTSSVHQEFVELYNPNNESVDLTDWYVQKKTGSGNNFSTFAKSDLFNGKIISAKNFILISHPSSTFSYDIGADYGISDNNTLAIKNPNGDVVDKVGWGEAKDCEESCALNPIDGQSIQRKFQDNEFLDINSNAQDFEIQNCPSPKTQTNVDCAQTNAKITTSTSTISHLVISEIQVKGENPDDEFIEIYNPNDSAISLADYSIQYLNGLATSTENIQKKNFSNSAQISTKSFYLLTNNSATSSLKDKADMTYASFSLSGNSSGAIIFLASSSSHISGIDDPTIVDYFSYGNPALIVSAATSTVPDANKSLERKAYSTSTVETMISEHKFSGNGYDSNSSDDFILTNVSNPQNSQNFPKPRSAPTTPQNFSIQYSSGTMSLNLTWSVSQDYSGATSTLAYKINNFSTLSTSDVVSVETTSTTASISLNENNFGKTFEFSITAFDKENLSSASSFASISIPNATLIIAQQLDKSASEQGTGNGQFYQYLGNGLLGAPKNVTFHAKFNPYPYSPVTKPHFIQTIFWESDNPDYDNLTATSTNVCYFASDYGPVNNCPEIQIENNINKDYTVPIQQFFDFNPEKYYKVTFLTYQADRSYFYGSTDANSYSFGKATKDNGGGLEIDAEIKDLYLKIESSAPIELPINISQSIPQNFELSYSTSSLALSLNWREPRYSNASSSILIYKITDISLLASGSSAVLSEINTAATSTTISLSEVGRKYKFSIQGFDANGSSTLSAKSKTINIPYSLLDQFIIAKQIDSSTSEVGTGNGQFYQYLGNGLSGTLAAAVVKVSAIGYYLRIDVWQYSDADYSVLENKIGGAASCTAQFTYYSPSLCSDYYLEDNIWTVPVQTAVVFDPAKYYKIMIMTYQSQSTFYGSADANSYANGQSSKDNGGGSETATSLIQDLYFMILSSTSH